MKLLLTLTSLCPTQTVCQLTWHVAGIHSHFAEGYNFSIWVCEWVSVKIGLISTIVHYVVSMHTCSLYELSAKFVLCVMSIFAQVYVVWWICICVPCVVSIFCIRIFCMVSICTSICCAVSHLQMGPLCSEIVQVYIVWWICLQVYIVWWSCLHKCTLCGQYIFTIGHFVVSLSSQMCLVWWDMSAYLWMIWWSCVQFCLLYSQ